MIEPQPMTSAPAAAEQASAPTHAGRGEKLLPFLIMAAVLLVDQATKYLVETRLPLYGTWVPIPALENIFRVVHTANTGAVFGLFQGTGMFFAALAVLVAVAIAYFNMTLPGGQWLLRVALGLQLGGALGNLTDRLRQGHVTDFVDTGPWYIWNLADLAIVSGVILYGITYWRELRREEEAKRAAEAGLPATHPTDPADSSADL